MKASASVFSLAVLIGLGAATLGLAQATARSAGTLNVAQTTNNPLLWTASGDVAAYSKADDQVAGKDDTTVDYTDPNPLPNPPPPALEKVDYDIVVRRLPLKGTYKGVGAENVRKFPRQVPSGVGFKAENSAQKADDAGKKTTSTASALVKATAPRPRDRSAKLKATGSVDRQGKLRGRAVAKASDPWTFTPETDVEFTLDVSVDIDLSASGERCALAIAQIEAYGFFDCMDCDDEPDPNLPVIWDNTWEVASGESYQGTENLVTGQTLLLRAGKTYELEAYLVTAADAGGDCPDPIQD